jgi:hypothetical protein
MTNNSNAPRDERQGAERPSGRDDRRRAATAGARTRVLMVLAAGLLALGGVALLRPAGGPGAPGEPTAGGEPAAPVVDLAGAPARGAPDAPLTLIEYSDYQ